MANGLKDYASQFARKGGKARAKKLSKARRQEIARKAVKARWKRAHKKGATLKKARMTSG